jgi:FeS assembly protein SufD
LDFRKGRDKGSVILEFQKKISDEFLNLSIPVSKANESWRKFNFGNFIPSDYSLGEKYQSKKILGKGFKLHNIEDLTGSDLIFVKTVFDNLTKNSDYFLYANLSNCSKGEFLEIESNVSLATTIRLEKSEFQLEIGKSKSFHPLTIIKIGDNSRVKITEIINNSHFDSEESFQWLNSLTYIQLGKNSTLEFLTKQNLSKNTFHFRSLITESLENSNFKNSHFYIGGYRGKIRQTHNLNGQNTEFLGLGITALSGREFIDSETEVIHLNHHTSSSIIHKTIVKDKAHHIFTGNLHIPTKLKKIIASQVNHNLSLSRNARAESIPKLEIFSEDVQSSHGSTVGEIDPEQLFYLKARGLDEVEAYHLLIEGFLGELIDSISDSEEAEIIRDELRMKIWAIK